MATHRLTPQIGPRRSLPAGLVPFGSVKLPPIVMRSPMRRGKLPPVFGVGDSPDFTPLLSQEQAALVRRTQDAAAAQSLTTLTSAQKSALANEATEANYVTSLEAQRTTAINNYNAATTAANQTKFANQINTLNPKIAYHLSLLVAASTKLASLGIQPSAAAVIASYANGAPVGTSSAAIPGQPPPPNVGTLPLGLPGQQPTVDNTIAVIQAGGAGNNVPTSAPGSSYVSQPVIFGSPYTVSIGGGGSSVPSILAPASVPVYVTPQPGIQPPRAGTINLPVPVAAPITIAGSGSLSLPMQPIATPPGSVPVRTTAAAPMVGSSGLPTVNASSPVITSLPPASQLFTDAANLVASPNQAGPSGDLLNSFVGNSNGAGSGGAPAPAVSVGLANPLAPGAKQLIPGIDNKITLIGGAVLLVLLLK